MLIDYFAYIWGRVPLPAPQRGADENLYHVRRYEAAHLIRPLAAWHCGRLAAGIVRLLGLIRGAALTFPHTVRYGRRARASGAAMLAMQWLDQLLLLVRHGVSPETYYQYELFRPDRRELASLFVPPNEATFLFGRLNRAPVTAVLDDKVAIERRLRAAGLKTPQTLAIARNDGIEWLGSAQTLPAADLIAKPLDASQGQGVHRFMRAGDGWRKTDGTCLDQVQLRDWFAARGRERSYLLQECLQNHSAIADLAPGSISSLRIVTGRWPDGSIEPLLAVLKIPRAGASADNFAAHGFAAPLDLASGAAGLAELHDPLLDAVAAHPQTGVPISGRLVPLWPQVLDAVAAAHRVCDDYVFVGWDVAVTEQGPVIIEGNERLDTVLSQKPGARPLAASGFFAIAAAHLRQRVLQ